MLEIYLISSEIVSKISRPLIKRKPRIYHLCITYQPTIELTLKSINLYLWDRAQLNQITPMNDQQQQHQQPTNQPINQSTTK